jgi:CRISPR-associated protein Cas2
MYLVVSYDIEDDKRRGRVHRTLKSFGQWVQYSVFECDLTRAQYLVLRHRLDDYVKKPRATVCAFTFCARTARRRSSALEERFPTRMGR